MSDHDVDRVPLNLRVDRGVKESFEERVREIYGDTAAYAGFELEQELRAHFGEGRLGDLVDEVHALAKAFGEVDRKNKFQTPDRGETEVVRYRVAQPLRDRIMSVTGEEFSHPGEFVERLMHAYAVGGGSIQKAIDRMDRVREAAKEAVDEEPDSVERRAQTLVNELGGEERDGLTLEEFKHTLETALNNSSHNRETYLPKVLDRLGLTWHPKNTGVFVPAGEIDLADQDPRAKPYVLMDEDDRRLALKYELFANGGFLTVEEAVGVLHGRPQRTTARQDLRAIGETAGFNYIAAADRTADDAEDGLTLLDEQAARQSPDHDDVREYLSGGSASAHEDETPTPNGPEITTRDAKTGGTAATDERREGRQSRPSRRGRSDWVTEAAEMVPDAIADDPPDPVVKNKAARAKWPADTHDDGEPTDEAMSRVSSEMVDRVCEELAEDSPPTDDTAADDVEAEMDQLMRATPANATVATDGGGNADD